MVYNSTIELLTGVPVATPYTLQKMLINTLFRKR